MSVLPHSNKAVSFDELESSILLICKELLPEWKNTETVKVDQISGGITNTLYKATSSGTHPALVRIYGSCDKMAIDRDIEVERMQTLYKYGFGPQVLGIFDNGRLESFLDGRPLEPSEMGKPVIIPIIAEQLSRFHNVPLQETKEPEMFPILNRWVEQVNQLTFDVEKQNRFKAVFHYDRLKEDISLIEVKIRKRGFPVVFSHNDLLSGNIMLKDPIDSQNLAVDSITIIDFEYASFSYRGYDLGNHFSEYAGFDGDFDELYPSIEQQRAFCAAYLKASEGKPNIVDHPTVESLIQEASWFSVLSHLYWGTWGILQARYSPVDFDFTSYAETRIQYYNNHRVQLLSEL